MAAPPTTLYAWDNERIIGEYSQTNQNGAAQQATETVYFGNTPVAVIQNGNLYRIYADQIDTPRVITDATGKTVWMWESKPFGETAPNEDPDKDGLVLRYNQRFPGQTVDAETGLHYNFHRDYNPATGRYVQSDPIGLDGGMNSFAYVGGMPVSHVDPDGKDAIRVVYTGCRALMGRENDAMLKLERFTAIYNSHQGEEKHNRLIALDGLPDFHTRLDHLKAQYRYFKPTQIYL